MRKAMVLAGCLLAAVGLLAESKPLWELPAERRGMELTRANAFDIAQGTAIPDHTAFTVELELRFDKPPTVFYQPLPLLDEEIGGTGFALCLRSYQPQGHDTASFGLFMRLNELNYEMRLSPFGIGEPLKLRVKFRKGFVVVSECHGGKWQMLKSYLRIVSPNERPIRVGDAKAYPPVEGRPDLRGARLESLRFWGSDYEVFAPNEDRQPARGVLSGEGFTMDVPVEEREERKRLLYVGDSISGGYSRFLDEMLADRAYPYHWWAFWGGKRPPVITAAAVRQPLAYRPYDMIVFNNGLHSLNWDEKTVTDDEIRAHYASIVDAFRANCPRARLVYMNTTPWGRHKTAQGGYVTGGAKNDVVRRLNRIADGVMRDKGVEVLDAYGLMSANLVHLYGDDDCHYRDEGYRLIARLIFDKFNASLPTRGCGPRTEPPNPVQLTRKAKGLREVPVFEVEHPRGGGHIKDKDNKIPVYDMPNFIMGNKRVCQLRFPWGGLDEFVQRSLVSVHCPEDKGFSFVFNRDDCLPIEEKDLAKWGLSAQYEYAVDERTETVRYRQPYVSKKTRDLKYLSFTMRKTGKPGEVEIVWESGGDPVGLIVRSNDGYRNWSAIHLGTDTFLPSPAEKVVTGGQQVIREFKDGSTFMGEGLETSARLSGLPKGPARACEHAWDLIRGNTHRRLNIYTAKALKGRILVDLGESPQQEQNANRFPPVNGMDFSLFNGIHMPRPSTRNELRNPSFEEGFYHWTYVAGRCDPGTGYEIVEGGVKGTRALLLKTRIGRDTACHLRSPMLYSMPMQLAAGEKYTLSFYIRRAGEPVRKGRAVEAVVSLGSNCRNATVPGDNMYGDASRTQEAYFPATEAWTRHSRTFTAGNGGFRVVLGATEGDVLFDALQLERGEQATDFVTSPIEAVITSAAADNQLKPGEPKRLGVRLVGKPGTRGRVKVSISNFYRETVYEESFDVTIGASGLVERPLGPDSERIGTGVFPVRFDVTLDPSTSHPLNPSTSYQRISVMEPLKDTKRPTARLFGTLIWPTRFGKPELLTRKLREWGVGSISWGGVSKRESPSRDFELLYGEGIVNVQHAIGNDLLRERKLDLSLFEDRLDALKTYDICRPFCMKPIDDAQARELTRAMTAYIRDADPRSALALSWWNEEEGGPGLVQQEKFEDYFRFQQVMVDAIKADGHRFKTTYSSGMSSVVDYKLPILEAYLATAKRHGVMYDAMTFHAYGHLDGGKLGFYDLDRQVGKIVKIMEKYGYSDDTEMYITELGNEIQLRIPEWFTLNGDTYQNGMPEYSFGHYEALNAASCARIWLMMLKYHPRMRHTNVWNSRPFMDAQYTPLFWCKAMNTVANLFPDCTFVADVRPADRIRGVAFRRTDGKGIVAIWQTDPKVDASEAPCPTASVRFAQPVRYVDLMQNERFVTPKKGVSTFAITYAPLFILADDVNRLVADLKAAKVAFPESTADHRRGESHALAGGEQEVINNLKR